MHHRLQRSLQAAPRRMLDTTLSHWVEASDRGLPHDLIRKSVGELLEADFDALAAAPGVGVAKLTKLMEVLDRVRTTEPHAAHDPTAVAARGRPAATLRDPTSPNSQWTADCQTVKKSRLETLPLGRLAPSLADLPRTLWSVPLGRFTSLSFEELQGLPYFGTRRAQLVAQLVHNAAEMSHAAELNGAVVVRQTISMQAVESWINAQLARSRKTISPTPAELSADLITPIATQLKKDLGELAAAVFESTLVSRKRTGRRKSNPITESVATLSRPRLHQIKEDIRHALAVRRPDLGGLLDSLAAGLSQRGNGEVAALLVAEMAEFGSSGSIRHRRARLS